jgi:hypothetical protein
VRSRSSDATEHAQGETSADHRHARTVRSRGCPCQRPRWASCSTLGSNADPGHPPRQITQATPVTRLGIDHLALSSNGPPDRPRRAGLRALSLHVVAGATPGIVQPRREGRSTEPRPVASPPSVNRTVTRELMRQRSRPPAPREFRRRLRSLSVLIEEERPRERRYRWWAGRRDRSALVSLDDRPGPDRERPEGASRRVSQGRSGCAGRDRSYTHLGGGGRRAARCGRSGHCPHPPRCAHAAQQPACRFQIPVAPDIAGQVTAGGPTRSSAAAVGSPRTRVTRTARTQ